MAAPNPLNGIPVLSNLLLVTLASANLAVVTFKSKILSVVTLALAIFAVVTAKSAIFAVVTLASRILVVVTFDAPIVVAPVLSIVTSPLIVTSAATLEELPTNTFPLVSAVPIGEAVIVVDPPKATVFPFIVTELFNNFAFVTLPSAILAVVTFASAIFAVVTFASASFNVVTFASAIFAVVTAASAIFAVVTAEAPIVKTPELLNVASPDTATSVA